MNRAETSWINLWINVYGLTNGRHERECAGTTELEEFESIDVGRRISVRQRWEDPDTVPLHEKIHRTVLGRGTGSGGRGDPPDREGSHHDTGRTHEPAHRGQLRWASEVSTGRVTICSHRVVDALVEEPRVERQSSGCTTRGLLISRYITIPAHHDPDTSRSRHVTIPVLLTGRVMSQSRNRARVT